MNLSESQWRKIETASRLILALTVIVGVLVMADTGMKVVKLEEKVKEGECAYLFESGYVERGNSPPMLNNTSFDRDPPTLEDQEKYSR